MPSKLPTFAAHWVQQWKNAAPRLQAIRDEELRRRGNAPPSTSTAAVVSHRVYEKYPERHGMVIMQQWWMRRHLLNDFSDRAKTTPDCSTNEDTPNA